MKNLARAEFEAVLYELPVAARTLTTQYLGASITLVAEHRMTNVLHVGTYLMSSTRFQNTFHQCYISETLHYLIVGYSRLAYVAANRKHRHAQTVFGVTPNITLYSSTVLCEVAPYQCVITAMSSLIKELRSQFGLCFRRLCHDKQSAGVFIYAMHQSHLRVVWVIRW